MTTPTMMAGDDDNALVVQRLGKLKEELSRPGLERLELLLSLPSWLSLQIKSKTVDTAFTILGEAMLIEDNSFRQNVVRTLRQCKDRVTQANDLDYLCSCLITVLGCNDATARVLAMQSVGYLGELVAVRRELQHSITSSLASKYPLEVRAAVEAVTDACRHSDALATALQPQISRLLKDGLLDADVRLRLIRLLPWVGRATCNETLNDILLLRESSTDSHHRRAIAFALSGLIPLPELQPAMTEKLLSVLLNELQQQHAERQKLAVHQLLALSKHHPTCIAAQEVKTLIQLAGDNKQLWHVLAAWSSSPLACAHVQTDVQEFLVKQTEAALVARAVDDLSTAVGCVAVLSALESSRARCLEWWTTIIAVSTLHASSLLYSKPSMYELLQLSLQLWSSPCDISQLAISLCTCITNARTPSSWALAMLKLLPILCLHASLPSTVDVASVPLDETSSMDLAQDVPMSSTAAALPPMLHDCLTATLALASASPPSSQAQWIAAALACAPLCKDWFTAPTITSLINLARQQSMWQQYKLARTAAQFGVSQLARSLFDSIPQTSSADSYFSLLRTVSQGPLTEMQARYVCSSLVQDSKSFQHQYLHLQAKQMTCLKQLEHRCLYEQDPDDALFVMLEAVIANYTRLLASHIALDITSYARLQCQQLTVLRLAGILERRVKRTTTIVPDCVLPVAHADATCLPWLACLHALDTYAVHQHDNLSELARLLAPVVETPWCFPAAFFRQLSPLMVTIACSPRSKESRPFGVTSGSFCNLNLDLLFTRPPVAWPCQAGKLALAHTKVRARSYTPGQPTPWLHSWEATTQIQHLASSPKLAVAFPVTTNSTTYEIEIKVIVEDDKRQTWWAEGCLLSYLKVDGSSFQQRRKAKPRP
eukprot:m.130820 g.130820  ORF g.130820 m.130820 type:complete len:885 (+) comp15892_c0_seq1:120-2774(+)